MLDKIPSKSFNKEKNKHGYIDGSIRGKIYLTEEDAGVFHKELEKLFKKYSKKKAKSTSSTVELSAQMFYFPTTKHLKKYNE